MSEQNIGEFSNQLHEASALVADAELDSGAGEAAGKERVKYSDLTDEEQKRRTQFLIRRAEKQAQKGTEQLVKQYPGLLAVRREAKINNRFVARSFQRFFASTEFAIMLAKRNESRLVFSDGKMNDGLAALEALIADFKEGIEQDLRAVREIYTQSAKENHDFIVPTYLEPALDLEVSILTPQGNGLYRSLQSYDQMIEMLTVLYWNGIYPQDRIQDAEQGVKKGMRKIYSASRQIILGLNRKFEQMVAKDSEGANQTVA